MAVAGNMVETLVPGSRGAERADLYGNHVYLGEGGGVNTEYYSPMH